jgi:hypothetical protein
MAKCPKCDQTLVCPEGCVFEVSAVGKCPVRHGALWVTVKGGGTDKRGVLVDIGAAPQPTDVVGLAHFEPLAEPTYTATLGDLGDHAASFDPPEALSIRDIPVRPGKIASVSFTLRRRPDLAVSVTPDDVPVDVALECDGGTVDTKKGCTARASFSALKPGDYTIRAEVPPPHADAYAAPATAPEAKLVYDADGRASIVLVERVRPTMELPVAIAIVGGARAKLKLNTHVAHDGKGTLTLTGSPAAVNVYGAVDKGGGVYEIDAVPGTGVELELEAVSASAFEGIGIEWALDGGSRPCAPAVKGKLTAAVVQLVIHDNRRAEIAADVAEDRTRGRVVHVQDVAKARARAKLVVKCEPAELADRIVLSARGDKLGLHTADTGDAPVVLPATKPPVELWVQGDKVSDAVGDCGLELALDGVLCSKVACTVVEVKLEVGDVRPDPGPRPAPTVPWPDPGLPPRLGDDAKRDPGRELYVQGEQFMSPRAWVRVLKLPHDAPCTLRLVRSGDEVRLLPKETDVGGVMRSGEEHATAETPVAMPYPILPGDITAPADGMTFWAEGAQTSVGKVKLQIDIDDVDVECDHASFTVVKTFFEITVKRRDNAPLSGAIPVELRTKQTGLAIAAGQVDALTGKARIEAPPGAYLVSLALPGGELPLQMLRGTPTPAPTEAGGDLEAAVQLKSIAETKLEYELAPKPVYTHVQFIAYRVQTGEYRGEDVKANFGGDIEAASKHDILQRCKIMTQAVKDARAHTGPLDAAPSTLKLFMAPEFYFRGKLGAYPYETISMILDEMRKETAQAKYQHWLFVFGSAIGFISTKDRVRHDGASLTISSISKTLDVECEDGSPEAAVAAGWTFEAVSDVAVTDTVNVVSVTSLPADPGEKKLRLEFDRPPVYGTGRPRAFVVDTGGKDMEVGISAARRLATMQVTCVGFVPAVGWTFEQPNVLGLVTKATKVVGDDYLLEVDLKLGPLATDALTVQLFEPGDAETLNIAQVQRGGPGVPMNADGSRALKELLVYKENVSSVDFAGIDYGTDDFYRAQRHQAELDGVGSVRLFPTPGSRDVLSVHPNTPGTARDDGKGVAQAEQTTESTKSGLGGGSIFTMDDITFGLEVCLDHGQKKLRDYYDNAQAPGGERKPQIQLIPSCGMSIVAAACVTNLVFNVDARRHRASKDSGASLLTALTPTKTPTVPSGITITEFFRNEGELAFYEKQDIPPPTTV